MPEIMQLGPDDNEINPYLTPCPDDYPPCPLCGNHPDMFESGHIICCNIIVDSSDAWFLLPRALRWTHEPPKVAGKYWWRPSGKKIGRIRDMFVRNGEVGFLDRNDRFIKDTGDGEWAGPIPAPID
jgi:hypothetical protein